MYFNQIFELSMILDNEKFQKVLTRAYNRADYLEGSEDEYIDRSSASKGIMVIYRDSQYKKKVKIIVNISLVLGCDKKDSRKLIRNLNKRVGEYFGYEYRMNDFELSGVIFTSDIDVNNCENVVAYLKVLQRIGKVKGFSPISYDCFDENDCFSLKGKSNGIEFLIYDLEGILREKLKKTDANRKKHKLAAENIDSILRTEVRLTNRKVIRCYTNAIDIVDQIAELSEKRWEIFLDIFTRIVPFGDYYKKDKAVEIIRSRVEDRTLRRKMLRLLALIPEKKSLYLAQKAMNCRNIEKVMDMFAKINVSPVTISKRHDVKYLKNLYSYLSD